MACNTGCVAFKLTNGLSWSDEVILTVERERLIVQFQLDGGCAYIIDRSTETYG